MNNATKNYKLDNISIATLIVAGTVLLISFFAPIIFVQESKFGKHFVGKGEIGDTVGGLMNPFVALAGVFLTFLAFYIQFKANNQQREIFRQELDFNKFENQFYEMLKLHKENVNEIKIDQIKIYKQAKDYVDINRVEGKVSGREAFIYMMDEFKILYQIVKIHFPKEKPKTLINQAYGTFFHGLKPKNLDEDKSFRDIHKIKTEHEKFDYKNLPEILNKVLNIKTDIKDQLHFKLFEGYAFQLAHYYRHLYQTVKFVVNQNSELLTYNEKRKYLRILRAQLSNQEQAMLFYNWLSSFGGNWENDINKYFTDYRMIHNIYRSLLISDIKLDEIFDLNNGYMKEENREFDPLFEFQDWKK